VCNASITSQEGKSANAMKDEFGLRDDWGK
jgi:hypothetical protein